MIHKAKLNFGPTSGCGGYGCGFLTTFKQGVQGDDVFGVWSKAC